MPNEVVDEFLDVDFTKDPRFIVGDTTTGVFGFPSYEASFPILPRNKIIEACEKEAAVGGRDMLVDRIYDQKQEGSCLANAIGAGVEGLIIKQFGYSVWLSAISLYKRIGSSARSGATLPDGLKEIRSRGILPLDTPENRAKYGNHVMPNTGFNNSMPSEWQDTARMFACVEFWVVNSMDGLLTASVNGHDIVVGREGHAVLYKRLLWEQQKFIFKTQNSWGKGYGDKGFIYDSERLINQSARYAIVMRSMPYLAA